MEQDEKSVEQGLLTFYSFLKKLGEDKEFLEIIKDLKVAWDLLNKFFEIHREKIKEIQESIKFWHGKSDKDIKKSIEYIKNIPNLNKVLNSILKQIIHSLKDADKLLFDSIIEKNIQNQEELRNYIKKYLNQIKENFKNLRGLYKHQNKYLESKSPGQIENELRNYSLLYRFFSDEAELDKRLKIYIKNLVLVIQIKLKSFERRQRDIKTKQAFGLRVEAIIHPNHSDLNYFYKNFMEVYFPEPDEYDELKVYREAAEMRYNKRYFGNYAFHLLMLKSGPEIVGGAMRDFSGDTNKKNCFGVIWFIAIKEEYRSVGFRMLMGYINKLMLHDQEMGGYARRVGLFLEVEDINTVPLDVIKGYRKVMPIYNKRLLKNNFTKEEIGYMLSLKPKKIPLKYISRITVDIVKNYLDIREEIYRIAGFRRIYINYVQPALGKGAEPVYYLKLYLLPMVEEWKQNKKIPRADFLEIFPYFYWCFSTGVQPEKDPSYLKMLDEIKKKDSIELI